MNKILQATGVIFTVVATLLLSGCGQAQGTAPQRPPASVSSGAVIKRDVPVYADEIGRCTASESVSIQPQASGRVTEIHFKDGAEVKKGDKLFTIDPRPYEVALQHAQAEHTQNIAELAQAETTLVQQKAERERSIAGVSEMLARLELNKLEFQRMTDLVRTDAVSRQLYDEKKMAVSVGEAQVKSSQATVAMSDADLKHAEAEVAVARAKLESSQAAIAAAKLNLEYATVVSPIDGRAGQRLVDAGNVVTTTNPTTMLVLQKLSPVYVDFTVPELELTRLRAQMSKEALKVEVRAADAPEQVFTGELSFLDNLVQSSTGTVKLRAALDNKERKLWPGQFVKVRLILSMLRDALLVPSQAIQTGQLGPYVYAVKDDSTVEMRPVKPGQRHGELVVISEGLTGSERIVVTGQLALFPGAPVMEKGEGGK